MCVFGIWSNMSWLWIRGLISGLSILFPQPICRLLVLVPHLQHIHNSQDMKSTYVSTNRWMHKENVGFISIKSLLVPPPRAFSQSWLFFWTTESTSHGTPTWKGDSDHFESLSCHPQGTRVALTEPCKSPAPPWPAQPSARKCGPVQESWSLQTKRAQDPQEKLHRYVDSCERQ